MAATRSAATSAHAALAALVLGLGACAVEPTESTAARELEASRERWEARGVEDYAYTLRRTCSCGPEAAGPVRVEVREGRAVSVTPLDRDPEFRTEAWDSLDNFRRLFDRVGAAMDAGPDELKAEYDPEWGHPVTLFVDPDRGLADDERGFVVEAFEPVR